MRCPDCQKFVGFDDGNVDEVDAEIDEESGEVTITGRVVLPCAECGTELKELNVDEQVETADKFARSVEAAIKEDLGKKITWELTPEWVEANCKVRYEMDEPDKEFHERTQTTVKVPIKKGGKVVGYKNKPIKSSRYMKTFKGVVVTGTVERKIHVSVPGYPGTEVVDEAELEHTVEEQSSHFDSLVD